MNNTQNNLNREKGKQAEEMAADYLKLKGYSILVMNFHYGKLGEIDIIAEKDNTIVFIEVRSRNYESSPDPIFSLQASKISTIKKVAEGFIFINAFNKMEFRFDFIKVETFTDPATITHIEHAF